MDQLLSGHLHMKVFKEIGFQRKHRIEHDCGLLLSILYFYTENLTAPSKGQIVNNPYIAVTDSNQMFRKWDIVSTPNTLYPIPWRCVKILLIFANPGKKKVINKGVCGSQNPEHFL